MIHLVASYEDGGFNMIDLTDDVQGTLTNHLNDALDKGDVLHVRMHINRFGMQCIDVTLGDGQMIFIMSADANASVEKLKEMICNPLCLPTLTQLS